MCHLRNQTLAVVFVAHLVMFGFAHAEENQPIEYDKPVKVGVLENDSIDESSGLARSHNLRGAFWTHNDSGDKPRLFLIDSTGKTLATYSIRGASATDWEDICTYSIDGTSYLAIGDIGDNARRRSDVRVYIVEEPRFDRRAPADGELQVARTIRCVYDKGPTDCESIAIDPDEKEILLASKRLALTSTIYVAPLTDESAKVTARAVASIGVAAPTAMDLSADGRRSIIVTYGNAFEFTRRAGEAWSDAFRRAPRVITMPSRRQGESICYGPDDRTLFLTSEKRSQPFWKVPIVEKAGGSD